MWATALLSIISQHLEIRVLQKSGTQNCSHKENNMAPSSKRKAKHMVSVSYTRSQKAFSQKGSDTISRGFWVWGSSNSQMLPSRRVLEPPCSSQLQVRLYSHSHAEAQLKVDSLGLAERGGLIYPVSSWALHLWQANILQSLHKNKKNRRVKW